MRQQDAGLLCEIQALMGWFDILLRRADWPDTSAAFFSFKKAGSCHLQLWKENSMFYHGELF